MHHGLLLNPRWAIGLSLEIAVALLAIRRRLFSELPIFTLYLSLVALVQIGVWGVFLTSGLNSRASFWTYWDTQGILVFFRAMVIGELARRILSPYEGVWALARMVLSTVAVILLIVAGVTAFQNQHTLITFISSLERGLEFAVIGTLGLTILFSRYYEIEIERPVMLIAIGLIVYSSIAVANSHVLNNWLGSYFNIWAEIRNDSFVIALLFWLAAVWKPLAARVRPTLLEPAVYGQMVPAMNFQLRQLNGRLSEMLR
jgi:hypothetical protein